MSAAEPTFSNLRAFVDQLRRDRDLAVVEAPVSARLEAAEIHRRVIAAGGPALLFTRVDGAELPLVTNLFGTARRAELAFGRRPRQLIERLVGLPRARCRRAPAGLWRARDLLGALMRVGTRQGRTGAVREIETD